MQIPSLKKYALIPRGETVDAVRSELAPAPQVRLRLDPAILAA